MRRPRAMLLGRLLADPELHCTPTGERVSTFNVATATAAPHGAAESWRCLAWNQGERQLADLVVDHLHAGDVVYVEGRLVAPLGAATDSSRRPPQILVRDLQLLESRGAEAGGKRRHGAGL